MVLEMDQAQRRDIDEVAENRITLSIDEENTSLSPYVFTPSTFVGNNWFKQGNNIVKLNVAEQDSLTFVCDGLSNLAHKEITNIIIGFDYDVSNVVMNYPILSNFSLTCMGMTNYFIVENILTTQGHIEVDCSLFEFSNTVIDTAIVEQGFNVGFNFTGSKSNATLKLSNVVVKFKFENKLQDEISAVANRLSASFDFFVDDEDLVLDFLGDGSGGRPSPSGGVDIDTVNRLIDSAISGLSVDLSVSLLSNGFMRFDADVDRGDG